MPGTLGWGSNSSIIFKGPPNNCSVQPGLRTTGLESTHFNHFLVPQAVPQDDYHSFLQALTDAIPLPGNPFPGPHFQSS